MAPQFEDYVWRLQSTSPAFDIQLPQDLEWIDEFTWSPIQQVIDTTLTGALIVQEYKQQRGRPITLQGKDDMGWISRVVAEILMQMRDTAGIILTLQFVHYDVDTTVYGNVHFQYDVMFRHYEPPPLELESVLRFDNFESTAWHKVRNIKFMEAIPYSSEGSTPCTANVTLTISGLVGTFTIGETVTGGTSGTTGTVLSFSDPTLGLYVLSGTFTSGETITGDTSSATAVVV